MKNQNMSECCCNTNVSEESSAEALNAEWITGVITTKAGKIPLVSTDLTLADKLGSWKARWGIKRMGFIVTPGLYAVGNPTSESYVFVTANYKMSFDHLRSQLGGRDAWIIVLDTKGINVWCAAGKGTFGTDELVNRMDKIKLSEIVTHRKLILPQLGATGVSAHEVENRTGFKVIYGPILATDLPAFVDSHMSATRQMRSVRFSLTDRLPLIPIEITNSLKYILLIVACFFLLSGLSSGGYSFEKVLTVGLGCVVLLSGAYLAGTVLTPVLLPWLPGRSFASKGAWAGLIFVLTAYGYSWIYEGFFGNMINDIAWILLILAISSFLGMNFTGASTYTSLSGVRREMRIAVPLQIAFAVIGFGLWLTGRFI